MVLDYSLSQSLV